MRKLRLIIFAVFAAFLFLSCKNYALPTAPTAIPVSEISITSNKTDVSLVIGLSHQLQTKVLPDNATNKKLTYTSDNAEIASVNADGLITAKKAGQAVITIKAADGISKEITVTVTAAHIPVTSIVLSPDEDTVSLVKGSSRQLKAQVKPDSATDKTLTFSSSAEGIASVNAGGLITAHKIGEAVITIQAAGNVSKAVKVNVTAAPVAVTDIVFDPALPANPLPLSVGGTCPLHAKAQPENATDKKLTYTSDNAEIASVNADGLITAKKAGQAVITIKAADGISKTIKITVTAAHIPVTSIVFTPPLPAQPIELVIGQVYKFGAKAMPEEAANKKLTFTTSNSSIAWLCGEGNSEVKADGLGEATVTITSDDNPSVRETVRFKMKQKPSIQIKTHPAVCESNGGEAAFTIETLNGKLDYTPEAVEGGAKWLSVAGKDHTDESTDTVRLTVQANKTVWDRTACIRFKDNITNEYIKISSKKYLEVQLTQKKNKNPNVTVRWVHGITPPKEEEKEKIEVLKDGAPTGKYHNTDYVFYWPETLSTAFFNTRKVSYTGAPDGGYPDSKQCWAKTDSNMLHWWFEQNESNINRYIAKKGITEENNAEMYKMYKPVYTRGLLDDQENIKSSIANLFRKKCIDKGGDPANGLQWYLFGLNDFKNARPNASSPALFKDVFNEGNTPIKRETIYTKKEFEDTLKAVLESQKAVGLNRYGADGSQHAITLWGAAFDEDNNIIAIYVGDNNDVSNKIIPYGIWYKEEVDIYAETEPDIDQNDTHRFNPYFFNYSNNSYNENHYIGQIITLDKGEAQWKKWLDANQ